MATTQDRQYLSSTALIVMVLVLVSLGLTAALLTDFDYLPFAIVFGIIWLLINLRYQYVGLIAYSIFILVRPNEFIGFLQVPFPIEKALAAPVALGLLIKLIWEQGSKLKFNNIDRGVMLFMAVALASVITAIWVQGAWMQWQDLLRLFIIYVFISRIVQTKKQLRLYVFFFILTTAFHAFASTINYYRGIREYEMGIERALGLDLSYGDPNSLAATIIYTLPFIYYYARGARSIFTKALLMVIFGVCLWCIVLTGSRTGMTAIAFLLFLTLFEFGNKARNFAIAVIFMGGILVAMPDQYRERLYSTTDLSGDSGASQSAQGRIDGFVNGVRMMIERPLLGVGVGMYPIAHGDILGLGYWEAHNLPGQLLGDLGLLGLVAFVAWMASLFKGLSRVRRFYESGPKKDTFMCEMAIALKLQILCLFYMGLGGHNLYRFNWFIVAALIAVMLTLSGKEKAELEAEVKPDRSTAPAL